MSSCHREDQGERPPGARNALFFPVVFRKAVINLIPPSSLSAGGRGAGQRMGHSLALPEKWGATNKKKRGRRKSTV